MARMLRRKGLHGLVKCLLVLLLLRSIMMAWVLTMGMKSAAKHPRSVMPLSSRITALACLCICVSRSQSLVVIVVVVIHYSPIDPNAIEHIGGKQREYGTG